MEVGGVVFLGEEAGLTVVTALHDVQGDAAEMDAGAAGHESLQVMICRNSSLAPFPPLLPLFSAAEARGSAPEGSVISAKPVLDAGATVVATGVARRTRPCSFRQREFHIINLQWVCESGLREKNANP